MLKKCIANYVVVLLTKPYELIFSVILIPMPYCPTMCIGFILPTFAFMSTKTSDDFTTFNFCFRSLYCSFRCSSL